MCGIAGFYVKNPDKISSANLQKFADELLYGIEHRGGDATGYVARTANGVIQHQVASGDTFKFMHERRTLPLNTNLALFHTRYATQGSEIFPENNHPVICGDIYGIHNGHIMNDNEIIEDSPYPRIGKVDSEAIVHAVRQVGISNANQAFERLEGAAAVSILNSSTGEFVIARGYMSPLTYCETNSLIVWASTKEAIITAWEKALGTPPNANRFRWVAEGTSFYFDALGNKDESRFEPYAPQWYGTTSFRNSDSDHENGWIKVTKNGSTYYYKPKDDTDEYGTPVHTDRFELVDIEDDTETRDCDACNEEMYVAELFEIFGGFFVCSDCEKFFDEADNRQTRSIQSLPSASLDCGCSLDNCSWNPVTDLCLQKETSETFSKVSPLVDTVTKLPITMVHGFKQLLPGGGNNG